MNWTEGYAAEADYVTHYTPELNPGRMPLLLANAGLMAPERIETACELGFGLGLSTNVHAAASRTTWWGTDFSPSQTLFAQQLARAAGSNIHLVDDAFVDFCHRPDLPDFDFVALHGVWSWISEANRNHILDFLRRKLKPGGVLYVSYNTLPGWAQMIPVRHLMHAHAQRVRPQGEGPLRHAEEARSFVSRLLAENPHLKDVYPLAARMVDSLSKHTASYIAHEYLNLDWVPMAFTDVAHQMNRAKLSFACSASPAHHFDDHFLVAAQQAFLREIADDTFRETTRDYLINRQFRKDYWVKGAYRLSGEQAEAVLRRQRVVLIQVPGAVEKTIKEAAINNALPEPLVALLLEHLSDGYPRELDELMKDLPSRGYSLLDVRRAILVMVGNGALMSAQDDAMADAAAASTRALNHHILKAATESDRVTVLASPITGGGINLPQYQLQMLHARTQGADTPEALAQAAWAPFRKRGIVLQKNGQPLVTEQENLEFLAELGRRFETTELPLLKTLRCVD